MSPEKVGVAERLALFDGAPFSFETASTADAGNAGGGMTVAEKDRI